MAAPAPTGRKNGVETVIGNEIHRQTVRREERVAKVQEHFAVTDPNKSACVLLCVCVCVCVCEFVHAMDADAAACAACARLQ
jgi:hypothetical protein